MEHHYQNRDLGTSKAQIPPFGEELDREVERCIGVGIATAKASQVVLIPTLVTNWRELDELQSAQRIQGSLNTQ